MRLTDGNKQQSMGEKNAAKTLKRVTEMGESRSERTLTRGAVSIEDKKQ